MVLLPSNLGFLFLSRCLIFKVQFAILNRCLSQTAQRVYHIPFAFVNTFFEVFSIFFKIFSSSSYQPFLPLPFGSPQKARLYYHLFSLLSTVFYNLFWMFCTNSDLSVLLAGRFCVLQLKSHYILCVVGVLLCFNQIQPHTKNGSF